MSNRPVRIPKMFRKYVEAAIAAGYTLDTTKSGHPRLIPPKGAIDPYRGGLAAPITMPGSAYDGGSHHWLAAELRRRGINVKH